MGYSALTGLLRIGWPKPFISTAGNGTEYAYRGPTATLAANQPLCQQVWADGNPVDFVSAAQIDFSNNIIDMKVRTKTTFGAASAEAGPTLLDTHLTIKWLPIDRPLEHHPFFAPGGSYDLSVGSGDDFGDDNWTAIWGWMAETAPDIKAAGQFYLRDANGEIQDFADGVATLTGRAEKYCGYLQLGFDTFRDYCPMASQKDIYIGYDPPTIGNLGVVDTPPGSSGSDYPSGYTYIKNEDSRERTGRRAEFHRFQSWLGATYVAFDRTHLY